MERYFESSNRIKKKLLKHNYASGKKFFFKSEGKIKTSRQIKSEELLSANTCAMRNIKGHSLRGREIISHETQISEIKNVRNGEPVSK